MLSRWPSEALERLDLTDLTGEEPSEVDEEAEAERQLRILRQWKAVDRMMIN